MKRQAEILPRRLGACAGEKTDRKGTMTMKKWISLFLTVMMILTAAYASGEEFDDEFLFDDDDEWYLYQGPEYDYEHLVVGHMTALSGSFTTKLFSYSTSDLDVNALLNGYTLTEWKNGQGNFDLDETVVSGMTVLDNADGSRSYVLTLYNDLKFSDGTPITAWDYAFTFLLNTAPQSKAIGGQTNQYAALLGVQDYRDGKTPFLAGVRVLKDDMMIVTVSPEYRPFYYEMGLLMCEPLPIQVIAPECKVVSDENGVHIEGPFTAELLRETLLDPENGYISHPSVVSGPYCLLSFDGTTAEMEINEYYKGNSDGVLPSIPHITCTLAEKDTMMGLLENGGFGLLNKVTDQELIREGLGLVASGNWAMKAYPRIGQSFIAFCCENEDTVGDKLLRQAITYCIDRDTMISAYTGGYGLRMDGYMGLGQWMYRVMMGTLIPEEMEAEMAAAEEAEAGGSSNMDYKRDGEMISGTRSPAETEELTWMGLDYSGIKVYEQDLSQAEKLLDEAGWSLNEKGESFVKGEDELRFRQTGEQLIPLELNMLYPEGNTMDEQFEDCVIRPLAEVGIRLIVEPVEWRQLLRYFYREDPRDCDMIYLASNFNLVFDPWPTFDVNDADIGKTNYTAIRSQELMDRAMDMTRTAPGDSLSYQAKWILFQECYEEEMPAIPLYGNVYFDFFTSCLHDYEIDQTTDWGTAIVFSYMGDAIGADELEEGEGEFFFDD